MPSSTKNGWAKVIVPVIVSVVAIAFVGFLSFLGHQFLAMRSDMARGELEDAKKFYELQKELALLKLVVETTNGKVARLERTLKEERDATDGISDAIGDANNYLDFDAFFVDRRSSSDEDHQ